jgi:hypothetical protein
MPSAMSSGPCGRVTWFPTDDTDWSFDELSEQGHPDADFRHDWETCVRVTCPSSGPPQAWSEQPEGTGIAWLGDKRLLALWLDHPVDHLDDPTGPVWIRPDRRASDVSRPDRSGADQIDAEHQATDLAVGVRIPRGVHNAPGQRLHSDSDAWIGVLPDGFGRIQSGLADDQNRGRERCLPGHCVAIPLRCGWHASRHSSQAGGVGEGGVRWRGQP